MTWRKRTIMEMAREARFIRQKHNLMSNPMQHRFSYECYEEELESFAALVREEAQAEEREACAKVCEDIGRAEEMQAIGNDYAEAIRARGQA